MFSSIADRRYSVKTSSVVLLFSVLAFLLLTLGADRPAARMTASGDPDPDGKVLERRSFLSSSPIDTAEDIMKRYLEVIGGRSAIDKIETLVVKASYFYPETGEKYDASFYWKRPDLTRAEFNRKPKQIIAYDGKKTWTASVDPATNALA